MRFVHLDGLDGLAEKVEHDTLLLFAFARRRHRLVHGQLEAILPQRQVARVTRRVLLDERASLLDFVKLEQSLNLEENKYCESCKIWISFFVVA